MCLLENKLGFTSQHTEACFSRRKSIPVQALTIPINITILRRYTALILIIIKICQYDYCYGILEFLMYSTNNNSIIVLGNDQ